MTRLAPLPRISLLSLPLLLGLGLGACADDGNGSGTDAGEDGGCVPGTLLCECIDASECEDGLTCTGGICADLDAACGDGVVDPGEECDEGTANAPAGACTPECTVQACGDGYLGEDEPCDDGNDVNDDDCSNQCTLPVCGDGIVQDSEPCDDGNEDETDECTTACELPECGDGFVQEGEDCDDQNTDEEDGCLASCEYGPLCGDGIIVPGELCFEGEKVLDLDVKPGFIDLADVVGNDGVPDVVLVTNSAEVVVINGSTQAVAATIDFAALGDVANIALGHFDDGADELPDVALTFTTDSAVLIYQNTGSVAVPFQSYGSVSADQNSLGGRLVTIDVDADGRDELMRSFRRTLSASDCPNAWFLPRDLSGDYYYHSAGSNCSGTPPADPPLMVPMKFGGTAEGESWVAVLEGDILYLGQLPGSGTITPPMMPAELPLMNVVSNLFDDAFDATAADVDGDGSDELLVVDLQAQQFWVIDVNPDGPGFQASSSVFSFSTLPTSVEQGHRTSDGLPDAVYCSFDTTFASVHRALGNGQLDEEAANVPLAGNNGCLDLKMADFNADGVLDLVSAHVTNDRLVFRFSNP